MAGGWGKQGSGVPLAQRVRPGQAPADTEAGEGPARHCWVVDGVERRRRPGLLVEWRTTTSGWEGRVVYATSLRPGVWSLVEEWLPAAQLERR